MARIPILDAPAALAPAGPRRSGAPRGTRSATGGAAIGPEPAARSARRRNGLAASGRRRQPERRDPAATREALLAAASALFAERGFDGVTTDELARRSGVNKAMISYHFGGKLGLYRALLATTFEPIREQMAALRDAARPAPEALREFVAVFGELAGRRQPAFPAMLVRELLTPASPALPEIVPHLVDVLATVRQIIERGVKGGQFRAVDPLITHLSMVGALAFFFATAAGRARVLALVPAALRVKPPDADAFVRHMQDLMTLGLAKSSGRS